MVQINDDALRQNVENDNHFTFSQRLLQKSRRKTHSIFIFKSEYEDSGMYAKMIEWFNIFSGNWSCYGRSWNYCGAIFWGQLYSSE